MLTFSVRLSSRVLRRCCDCWMTCGASRSRVHRHGAPHAPQHAETDPDDGFEAFVAVCKMSAPRNNH
eukprot:7845514-Lingulodinium_polyedra.AAC.1